MKRVKNRTFAPISLELDNCVKIAIFSIVSAKSASVEINSDNLNVGVNVSYFSRNILADKSEASIHPIWNNIVSLCLVCARRFVFRQIRLDHRLLLLLYAQFGRGRLLGQLGAAIALNGQARVKTVRENPLVPVLVVVQPPVLLDPRCVFWIVLHARFCRRRNDLLPDDGNARLISALFLCLTRLADFLAKLVLGHFSLSAGAFLLSLAGLLLLFTLALGERRFPVLGDLLLLGGSCSLRLCLLAAGHFLFVLCLFAGALRFALLLDAATHLQFRPRLLVRAVVAALDLQRCVKAALCDIAVEVLVSVDSPLLAKPRLVLGRFADRDICVRAFADDFCCACAFVLGDLRVLLGLLPCDALPLL